MDFIAVIIPALVATIILLFIGRITKKLWNAFWYAIGWLVVNGHYFPSIMRPALKEKIAANDRELERLDKIIKERSMK